MCKGLLHRSGRSTQSELMRAIIVELKEKSVRDPGRFAVTASMRLTVCNIGGITLYRWIKYIYACGVCNWRGIYDMRYRIELPTNKTVACLLKEVLGKAEATSLIHKVRKSITIKTRWLKTKVLVIDKISVIDGELFDKLSQIGSTLRGNGRPWGGRDAVAVAVAEMRMVGRQTQRPRFSC